MTNTDYYLSVTETTLERVMDLYAGGSLHSLDTPLAIAYAEAPYGDVNALLAELVDYHESMFDSYKALLDYYHVLRGIADASEPLPYEDVDGVVQLPETD